MSKLKINPGTRFSQLVVIKEVERVRNPSGQINRVFECKCDCGNIKSVRLCHLNHGKIRSCGCIIRAGNKTPYKFDEVRRAYNRVKYRCSESYFERKHYFDRGIKMCDEWVNNYSLFKDWCLSNGYAKGLNIDRIDNNKGYSPDNCRWVTPTINANNKTDTFYVTYKGEKKAFCLLLRELNILDKMSCVRTRINRGWSVESAIETPKRIGNYKVKSRLK